MPALEFGLGVLIAGIIVFSLSALSRWIQKKAFLRKVASISKNESLSKEEKLDAYASLVLPMGFLITHRSTSQIQLTRKKKFSFLIALAGLLLWGVGLLIYLIWYLSKSDDIITFSENGVISGI